MLAIVTVVAFVSTGSPAKHAPSAGAPGTTTAPSTTQSTPPVAQSTSKVKVEAGGNAEDLAASALPPGAPYTQSGSGTFRVLPGTSGIIGSGPLKKYTIEVENGITGVDLAAFQNTIDATLADPRSWIGGKNVSLERVSSDAEADFRITLTSSMTVRTLCGYDQKIETSCWENTIGPSRVVLNVARWVRGDTQFGQDLATYHLYMINHEVGHALGHVHSFVCLPDGQAPVMMQQTITLKENQGVGPKICTPNAWPYPPGVAKSAAVTT